MDGYVHDVFISYRRAGNVADWVQLHLVEVLTRCLEDELDRKPDIFLDKRMEVGAYWPDELQKSLHQSRLMVAVLSPPYWTSPWCQAEWRTLMRREQAARLNRGLIIPLVYSDGDKFPPEARARQAREMKKWGYPYAQFANSLDYLPFHDAVRQVACEIAGLLDTVPTWNAGWPVERPESVPAAVPAMLPEL